MAWTLATLAIVIVSSLTAATPAGSQALLQLPLDSRIEVRATTVEDAATVSNIAIEAFKDAPDFRYVRQFFDQYPHDAYNCLKGEAARALTRPNVASHIAFVPAIEAPHAMTAVSASLWMLPRAMWHTGAHSRDDDPSGLAAIPFPDLLTGTNQACKNRDVNFTRAFDIMRQSNYLTKRYLNDVYPKEQQLYLALIATLPAYQGHDFAGHVLRRGLDMINHVPDDKLPSPLYATLEATPAGEPLYWENGYDSVKNITLHTLDTEETFRFDIMVKQLRP